jgi:hypothetical protein
MAAPNDRMWLAFVIGPLLWAALFAYAFGGRGWVLGLDWAGGLCLTGAEVWVLRWHRPRQLSAETTLAMRDERWLR